MTIRVATRGSHLALTQTRWVVARLEALNPGLAFQIDTYRTSGDRSQAEGIPLSQAGSKGLFTKELEEALLDGRADLAVHSLKDLPADLPPGLALGCVPEREDPRDVVISAGGQRLEDLPAGARVGTSSLRRTAQLRRHRPDLEYVPVRGNVETRLAKLRAGQYAAIVMAAAGLKRAGFAESITQYLDPAVSLPAVGQGALALEVRAADMRILNLLAGLHHRETASAVAAERAFLARLTRELEGLAAGAAAAGAVAGAGLIPPAGAGAAGQAPPLGGVCQVPVAAYATVAGGKVHLRGLVALPDGSELAAAAASAPADDPAAAGVAAAAAVLGRGGRAILARGHGLAMQGQGGPPPAGGVAGEGGG